MLMSPLSFGRRNPEEFRAVERLSAVLLRTIADALIKAAVAGVPERHVVKAERLA